MLNIPTLVILGCALVVTVPAVVAVFAVFAELENSEFKLDTKVVELTTNGETPVGAVDMYVAPLKLPYVPLNTPAVSVPST